MRRGVNTGRAANSKKSQPDAKRRVSRETSLVKKENPTRPNRKEVPESGSKKRVFNKATPEKKAGYQLNEKIRLNRFLANSGVCSRREADRYIETGCVTVNGKIVSELGSKVSVNDEVRFHGQQLNPEQKVYLLLNKPKGYVTTTDDPQERKTVMELIKNACAERIYPVGRLDKETTGVLLFTNDGEMVKKLTHPSYSKKKVYHVYLDKPLTKNHLLEIAKGIVLDDGPIAADAINYVDEEDKCEIGIEIHSGRNRIVRRIFEQMGYKVVKLDRVLFAGLTKKNVQRGKWRFLSPSEINHLKI
jgi:23S rRNA pseudouridine2605 synthase